ncbi:ATP-grasp peptide maturase system methyltransferase [Streptomyces albus]|uniref:ATP-grasp peptide maturase system methyltransferase n=1 Tax=Streptomyces albus TaxID=1888 RepID=UPI0036FD3E5F
MSTDRSLAEALADHIAASGDLRSPEWRRAVLDVPRHEFLRDGFFRRTDEGHVTGWEPVLPDDPTWLPACYSNASLVTQIAGEIVPRDIEGRIFRQPTSSSTMPGLVVRMLEELGVEDGMRVLEIGSGTGYSTGLLSHRLGDELVTSVEVDPAVSGRARAALGRIGHHPRMVIGDGLQGHREGAPYDRLIATCGVLRIPVAWLEQVKPGGRILATVGGWLYASELARLTVHEDGTATGRLLGGEVSFMLARPHTPPPLGVLPDFAREGTERECAVPGDALTDWAARFVAQLAVPGTQRFSLMDGDGDMDVLLDVHGESWAALRNEKGRWIVREGGPEPLWRRIEDALLRWERDGAPALGSFTVGVSAEGSQTVSWPSSTG